MANYVSNCPISMPRSPGWRRTWDLGGLAWSHEWGMFYDVPSDDQQDTLRDPVAPWEW